MNVANLKRDRPGDEQTEPLRAALAQALEQARAAEDAVASQSAAIARANKLVGMAEAKLADASAAVAGAREAQAQQVAEAVTAGAPVSATTTLRAARATEANAADELDAARAALAKLDLRADELAAAWAWAANTVIEERNKLIAQFADALLARARRAKMELAMCEAQLAGMLFTGDDGAPQLDNQFDAIRAQKARAAPLAEIKEEFARFRGSGNANEYGPATTAERETREAVGRLTVDAFAALPGLP